VTIAIDSPAVSMAEYPFNMVINYSCYRQGWRLGSTLDETSKLHPSLVAFAVLFADATALFIILEGYSES